MITPSESAGSVSISAQDMYGSGTYSSYTYTADDPPACFKEDTKILVLKDNDEKYIKIQNLRKGDLVKTLNNGYMKIDMIGKSELYNAKDKEIKKRLYICDKDNYPEIFDDLVITGCHSILVDDISDEQRKSTIELMRKIYVTDNKYRLLACLDERAKYYDNEGTFNIYHIALESEHYYANYGVYANGLLVETCSKRYLKELSGMSLL